MGGFQKQVNVVPAPGVPGRFASANPRFAFVAGPGGLIAGPGGVKAGSFVWAQGYPTDADDGPQVVVNFGSGSVLGFVANEGQGLIVGPYIDASLVVPLGFMVTAYTGGDFWVQNSGTTEAVYGQKAYANFATGAVNFAATGSPLQSATSTASTITAQTASVTGSITGNVLTVTAVGSGILVPGGVLSGSAGAGIPTGTTIVAQLSGSVGGIGTYSLSDQVSEQTIPSGTVTETYGLLTVGGTLTGTFGVGSVLTGTGVVTGSTITGLGTGSGGAGTYYTQTQAMSSSTVNANGNVETKWIAMSGGLPGEYVKISSQALG